MLKIDPDERISVDDAIKHPFFGNLRDPENEPTARPFVDNSEGLNLSIADLRREIWREIHSFNPRSLQSIFPEDFYSSDLGSAPTTYFGCRVGSEIQKKFF